MDTKKMAKIFFIFYVIFVILVCIGYSIYLKYSTSSESITLTTENFFEYYTYDVKSEKIDNSDSLSGGLRITITFYPVQDMKVVDGTVSLSINEGTITSNKTIPSNGQFSVIFTWVEPVYDVDLTSASGTITLK